MGPSARTILAAVATAVVLLPGLSAQAVIVPATVDDLCAPTDDPCVISDDVDVSDGPAVLDFGTRDVFFEPGHKLIIKNRSLTVHCGGFRIGSSGSVAILLQGAVAPGAILAGSLTINSYETCDDDPMQRCLSNFDCVAGACTDINPHFGYLTIIGGINGDAAEAATVVLNSAAGIGLFVEASLNGMGDGAGGGYLEANAGRAPLWVQSRISATGPYAGAVALNAASSADIDARIDVSGKFSAGDIEVAVDGPLKVNGRFDANAGSSSGTFGGLVALDATGDIDVGQGSLSFLSFHPTPAKFRASTRGSVNDAGGGQIVIDSSAGDVLLSPDVKLIANGGKNIFADGGSISLHGDTVEAQGRIAAAGGGDGGQVEILGGDVSIPETTRINVSGGASGGQVSVTASGDVESMAAIRARAMDPSDGVAGEITMAGANIVMGGKVAVSGATALSPPVELSGCNVDLAAGTKMRLDVTLDPLAITSREQLTVDADASVRARSGDIEFFYRSDGPLPVVAGSVTPAPVLVPSALAACAP